MRHYKPSGFTIVIAAIIYVVFLPSIFSTAGMLILLAMAVLPAFVGEEA